MKRILYTLQGNLKRTNISSLCHPNCRLLGVGCINILFNKLASTYILTIDSLCNISYLFIFNIDMEPLNLASSTYLHNYVVCLWWNQRGYGLGKVLLIECSILCLSSCTCAISNYLLNGVILQMKPKILLSRVSVNANR